MNAYIISTEPQQKYESTVENILRDKAHRWSLDYYKDSKSIYDVGILRAETMLALIAKENELPPKQKMLELLNKQMAVSPTKKIEAEIKAEESAIRQIRVEMSKLSYICGPSVLLQVAEHKLETLTFKRYLEKNRAEGLQNLRNMFMHDGDEDFLRRGVTWVESRFETLMATSSSTPVSTPTPVPYLQPQQPSEATWRQKKRRVSQDDDGYADVEDAILKAW
jgi:hypothetical protein